MKKIGRKNTEKLVVYFDETGIDKYIYRPNVRAPKGTKVYSHIKGKKFERISIVAGKVMIKFLHPWYTTERQTVSFLKNGLKNAFALKS